MQRMMFRTGLRPTICNASFFHDSASLSQSPVPQMYSGEPTPDERLAQFPSYSLTANLSALPEGDRAALPHLIRAGKSLDELYLGQWWEGNIKLRKQLVENNERKALEVFDMYKGPYARNEGNKPFIKGIPPHPEGANFYPTDITKNEFETWLSTLSKEEKDLAEGYYTTIRRANGNLTIIPFSQEYKPLLDAASAEFKKGAALVSDSTLKKFLTQRADAFHSNNYLESDIAWYNVSSSSPLEVTAGPYEVYDDELYGYKATYEIYIHVRDSNATETLQKFTSSLKWIEDRLPVPEKYRNTELKAPVIVVVNQIWAGGMGVPMTLAYNLPNDIHAIRAAGSKLVMMKNVHEAKFHTILKKIASIAIDEDQLDAEAFNTHTILHEVCHSNGPHHVLNHPDIPVKARLQDLHSGLEEGKADIAALYAAPLLIDSGVITDVSKKDFWVTFLAGIFRTVRFGVREAHGTGLSIALAYFIDKGAVVYSKTARFRVNFDKIQDAVADLTRDVLVIQGDGDKSRAQAFVDRWAKLGLEAEDVLKRIKDGGIPIDVRPHYPVEKELGLEC